MVGEWGKGGNGQNTYNIPDNLEAGIHDTKFNYQSKNQKTTVFLGVIAIIIVLAICSAKFNQIIRLNAKTRMKKFINDKQNSEQEKNKKMFSLCQRGGYLDTL